MASLLDSGNVDEDSAGVVIRLDYLQWAGHSGPRNGTARDTVPWSNSATSPVANFVVFLVVTYLIPLSNSAQFGPKLEIGANFPMTSTN